MNRPYLIGVAGGNPLLNLDVLDDPTLDLTISGAGTAIDKRMITGKATQSLTNLKDVRAGQPLDVGDVPVWRTDHWEFEPQAVSLPVGGTAGQVLTKQSGANGDALWVNVPRELPVGGTTGQALVKSSNTDYAVAWGAGGSGGSPVVEPVYSSSRRHATATAVANSTIVPVPFDTEDYTDGIPWNGNDFVIPVAGYYQVNAAITVNTMATGGPTVRMSINGSASVGGVANQSPGAVSGALGPTGYLNRVVKLAAGDLVRISVSQISGSASAIVANAAYNWVNITKIPSLATGGGGVVVESPIAARRQHGAATSFVNATITKIPFDTEVYTDGNLTWNPTLSAFIAPSDGYYDVEGMLSWATNATGGRIAYIYVNEVAHGAYATPVNGSTVTVFAGTVKALAGQEISVRTQQTSGGNLALVGNVIYCTVSVTKKSQAFSGSAVSTYGERNYATSRAHNAATSIPSGGAITPIPFDTVSFEDGIPFVTDGFPVPVAGYYAIEGVVTYAGQSGAAVGTRSAFITVNGTSQTTVTISPNATTQSVSVPIAQTIKLAAGDIIRLNAYQSQGVALTLAGGAAYNRISIAKVPAPVINGAAASGVWGAGPLAGLGSDSLIGREIYIDATGQLRAKPDAVYARAAGVSAMGAVTANGGVSLAITFPVGRFTVPPIVVASGDSNGFGFGMATGPTASGCTLRYYNPTASVPSNVKVHWTATQMTSTTAEG